MNRSPTCAPFLAAWGALPPPRSADRSPSARNAVRRNPHEHHAVRAASRPSVPRLSDFVTLISKGLRQIRGEMPGPACYIGYQEEGTCCHPPAPEASRCVTMLCTITVNDPKTKYLRSHQFRSNLFQDASPADRHSLCDLAGVPANADAVRNRVAVTSCSPRKMRHPRFRAVGKRLTCKELHLTHSSHRSFQRCVTRCVTALRLPRRGPFGRADFRRRRSLL